MTEARAIVKSDWDQKYYFGNMVAVSSDNELLAYALKGMELCILIYCKRLLICQSRAYLLSTGSELLFYFV